MSLHGIEGAFCEFVNKTSAPELHADYLAAPGSKTVIPGSVKGKFSIRLVPNLTIKETTDYVVKYLDEEFRKIGSKNRCEAALTHGGEPWIADPNVRPKPRAFQTSKTEHS